MKDFKNLNAAESGKRGFKEVQIKKQNKKKRLIYLYLFLLFCNDY